MVVLESNVALVELSVDNTSRYDIPKYDYSEYFYSTATKSAP
jgi:hypothetical protein